MTLWPNGTLSKPAVSSPYGPRTGGVYSFHYGTDFVGYSQIRAVLAGKVTGAGRLNSSAGNTVSIDSVDPATGRTVTVVRMHMASISVAKGQTVTEGQVLGIMGATGNATGNCDHVEIRYWSGASYTTEDPIKWFTARVNVGSGAGGGTAADQRVAAAVTNGRAEPTSQSALVGDPLQPGAVGNFVGWIRGESVSGNSTWYKGTSGRWFWSGGFTSQATTGLNDLNVVAIGAAQRKVGPNAANGRTEASTNAAITQTLPGGTVADFNAWKYGEAVEANRTWFRGAHSGDWFWSGGFEGGANTANLEDINPVQPPPTSDQRTVRDFPVNGRSGPGTSFPIKQNLGMGTIGTFSHWTQGESVTLGGITSAVWFKGSIGGNWFAAAGFTTQATAGLVEDTNPPTEAPPTSSDNPRGLPEYTPIYPGASIGLVAPLGDGLRTLKGSTPVTPVIDRFIPHHAAATNDQLDYFSYKNERSSCPSWYIRTDGEVIELIRPGRKPASTGSDWNWRSLSTENLDATGAPTWDITDAQIEANAQLIAWVASHDGKTLDGIPVTFSIDRTHVIAHREALPGTECPGPDFYPRFPEMVDRARVIYAEKYAVVVPPIEPPVDPGIDYQALIQAQIDVIDSELDKLSAIVEML